jgi:TonB family protein
MNALARCFSARAILYALAIASPSLIHAQTSGAAPTVAPTERAQRDADKVFRMILQHADTPRRAPRDDKTVAPAATTRAATRTTAPLPAAPSEAPATAPTEPPARVLAPAPAPAPAPAVPLLESEQIELAAAPTTLAPVASLAPTPVPRSVPPRLELVLRVEPEFPARVLRSVGSGKVVVHFDVRPDGTVARAEVAHSPHRGLNAAAEAAVLAWRFKPTGQTLPGQVEMNFE